MIVNRESNVCDDDSRDSGIAEMDCEMPTSFSDIFNSKDTVMEVDVEMTEEKFAKTTLSNNRSRLGLIDITNSNFESPKCRKGFNNFAKPFARVHSTFGQSRKRVIGENCPDIKRYRVDGMEGSSEANKNACPRRSIGMPRTHSSSVLERGQYAHVDDNLPKPLVVNYHLPTLAVDSQAYRRINASTLSGIMSSMSSEEFNKKYVLVDCRYPFEYRGGHIKDAINIYNPDMCTDLFYPTTEEQFTRIPIFYCEYSQKRGPTMAQLTRAFDRRKNMLHYPQLDHQEMYVLDKGYKQFYETHQSSDYQWMFEPCGYITMDDYRYAEELKQYTFHKKGFTVIATSFRKDMGPIRSRLRQRQNCDDTLNARTSQRKLFQHFETNDENVSPCPSPTNLPPIPNPTFT